LKTIILLIVVALFFLPQTQSYTGPVKQRFWDFWNDLNTPYYEYPESVEFTIERTYTISMPSGKSGTYELNLHHPPQTTPYPNGEPYHQQLIRMNTAPEHEEGNTSNSMHWEGNLTGGNSIEITISYTAKVEAIDQSMEASQSGTIDQIPQVYLDRYLGDEWNIAPNNSKVQELALELKAGTGNNVYLILENIYNYIEDNYEYRVGKEPKTCDQTLNKGFGDCDDLGILFVSIARAAGIPAWLELGLLSQEGFTSWNGHAWTNVVIPLVSNGQPAGHMIGVVDLANSYFLWMPPYRLSEWISNGNAEHLEDYYYIFRATGGASVSESTATIDYDTHGSVKRPVE